MFGSPHRLAGLHVWPLVLALYCMYIHVKHVCMYVDVYVCLHVLHVRHLALALACTYISICICAFMLFNLASYFGAVLYAYMCTCIYVCICVCMLSCLGSKSSHVLCANVCIYSRFTSLILRYVCMHCSRVPHTCTHISTCMYMYVCVCVCVYIIPGFVVSKWTITFWFSGMTLSAPSVQGTPLSMPSITVCMYVCMYVCM